jgi:putative PIN family toxin of toxin-antitoxin system
MTDQNDCNPPHLPDRAKYNIIGNIMRVVIDTNLLVAALRSRSGASYLLIEEWRHGKIEAAATVALFLEYEAVLKRPENRRPAGVSEAEIDILLDELSLACVAVESRVKWRPQLRDADDEIVLDAALNGSARAIVTFNRSDFLPAAGHFSIDVISPIELLRSYK